MSRFRYRLAAPLRLARLQQRELRRRLAEEIRREVALDRELCELKAARKAAASDVRRRAATGIDGHDLSLATVAIEAARDRASRMEVEQRMLRERLDATREELTGVGRKLRVLERLEREAHRAHHLALLRREQLEIDDLTLVRRGSNGRGGRQTT